MDSKGPMEVPASGMSLFKRLRVVIDILVIKQVSMTRTLA